ncbi:hypothetical protein QUA11_16215 [Microcoleus sp. S13_D1]
MPVPQQNSFFVEQASCLFIKSLLRMVQHFRLTEMLHHSRLTGKMPVPQENSLFVEQASCLFLKSLLTMVQHFR